jgi:hypothetical protein
MAGFVVRPVEEYLTKEQAANYLGVQVRRLERWRYLRKGPAFYYGPNGPKSGVRYLKEDLDEWQSLSRRIVPRETEQALREARRVA